MEVCARDLSPTLRPSRLRVFPSFQGIIVDGHLMGAPPKHDVEGRSRTYFDLLTVSTDTGGPGDITIMLSLDGVVVDGEGRDVLPIDQQGWVRRRGVTVVVDNHRSCWVELAKDIRFLVLLHQYQQPSYLQKAHLGFYVVDGRGLSASTQGLLGMAWCLPPDVYFPVFTTSVYLQMFTSQYLPPDVYWSLSSVCRSVPAR